MPKDHGIGASTKRREDVRFLTGRGSYTDDIAIAGQAHAVFVRSQVAHGRIRRSTPARPQRCRACWPSSPARISRMWAATLRGG